MLQVFEKLDSFLGDQADTVLLRSTFVARPRLDQDDDRESELGSATELFGEGAVEGGQDPYNTGMRNNKIKRVDKYEKVREVLEERSEAFFSHIEQ
jgi:hypothetical protein